MVARTHTFTSDNPKFLLKQNKLIICMITRVLEYKKIAVDQNILRKSWKI